MSTESEVLTAVKNIVYIPAFLVGLTMESYIILGVFLILDYVTGILRAALVEGCHSIRSYRAISGLISKSLIFLIPLMLAWAGRGAGIDMLFVAKGMLGMLIFSQLYSILGNIYSIYLGKNVVEFDAVNFLLRKLRDTLETFIRTSNHK